MHCVLRKIINDEHLRTTPRHWWWRPCVWTGTTWIRWASAQWQHLANSPLAVDECVIVGVFQHHDVVVLYHLSLGLRRRDNLEVVLQTVAWFTCIVKFCLVRLTLAYRALSITALQPSVAFVLWAKSDEIPHSNIWVLFAIISLDLIFVLYVMAPEYSVTCFGIAASFSPTIQCTPFVVRWIQELQGEQIICQTRKNKLLSKNTVLYI